MSVEKRRHAEVMDRIAQRAAARSWRPGISRGKRLDNSVDLALLPQDESVDVTGQWLLDYDALDGTSRLQ